MTSTSTKSLLNDYKRHLLKAIDHLKYSHQKVSKLTHEVAHLDLDQLESWESYSSRFSRTADIFLTKYLRTLLLTRDPAYQGSMLDSMNEAEKLGLITDSKIWYRIRELRNKEAHEYNEVTLSIFFKEIHSLTPHLFNLEDKL